MLPPQLHHGLRPSSLAVARGACAATLTPSFSALAMTTSSTRSALGRHSSRSLSWWHRKPSPFFRCNPYSDRQTKSQHRIVKPRFLDVLHRKPATDINAAGLGWRWCSSWGRPGRRWTESEDPSRKAKSKDSKCFDDGEPEDPFELSPRERFWRQRMEIFRKRVEEDPYSALFGRSLDRLAGMAPRSIWDSPLIPKWVREELELDSKPESKKESEKTEKSQEKFSINGTKTTQQSATQDAEPSFEYDPISNRMVFKRAHPTGTTPQSGPSKQPEPPKKSDNDEAVGIPVKPYRPKLRSEATVQPNVETSEWFPAFPKREPVDPLATGLAEYDKKHSTTPPQKPVDPVAAGLAEYDNRMYSQRTEPWLVQEGFADKPQKTSDVPSKDEEMSNTAKADSQSRYTQVPESQTRPQRPSLPKDDIDLLRPSDVRAGMGISKRPVIESPEQKEERRSRLEKNFTEVHEEEPSDIKDFRIRPQARETTITADKKAITAESTSRKTEDACQYGALAHDIQSYNETTKKLETALSRHREKSAKLETALTRMSEGKARQDKQRALVPQETAQAHNASSAENVVSSNNTQGLRTSVASALDRLVDTGTKIVQDFITTSDGAALPAKVDSTITKPKGLDVCSGRELAAAEKLENEIKAQKAAWHAMEEDGYSREPMGLETAYAREVEACKNGRKTLEQELSEMDGGAKVAATEQASARDEMVARDAAAKIAQKARDIELVREVRKIYEDHYGVIDTKHRQGSPVSKELEGRVDEQVHKCLGEHDQTKRNPYHFTPDNLEAELSSPPTTAAHITMSNTMSLPSHPAQASRNTVEEPQPSLPAGTASQPTSLHPAQAAPVHDQLYTVLAYDVTTGEMTRGTMPGISNAFEAVLPLTAVLTGLARPEKFLPYLSEMQNAGLQPVSGTSNMIIFKQTSPPQPHPQPSTTQAVPNAPRARTASSLNPIDGTARSTLPPPQTGNFASPTGFVNHDVPPPPAYNPPASASAPPTGPSAGLHYHPAVPRFTQRTVVRRTEPVFSGSSRREAKENRKKRKEERKKMRRFARKAGHVAATAGIFAFGAYVIGVLRGLYGE